MSFKIRNVYKQQNENIQEKNETNETDETLFEELNKEKSQRNNVKPSNNKISSSIKPTQFEKGAEQDSY